MPTYTYKCDLCQHQFEAIRTIANMMEPTNELCPACGESGGVRKLIDAPKTVSGVGSMQNKAPDVFKDRLKEIKKAHPGGNL